MKTIIESLNSNETILISKYGLGELTTVDITLKDEGVPGGAMQCRLNKYKGDNMSDLGIIKCINHLRLELSKRNEEVRR